MVPSNENPTLNQILKGVNRTQHNTKRKTISSKGVYNTDISYLLKIPGEGLVENYYETKLGGIRKTFVLDINVLAMFSVAGT